MEKIEDFIEGVSHYLEEEIDFNSPWIWISFGMLFVNVFIWLFILLQVRNYSDLLGRVLLFIILVISTFVEKALYIQALRIQPKSYLKYEYGVFLPTIMFYCALLLYLIFAIIGFCKSFMKVEFLRSFSISLLISPFMELSFALAYGSAAGYFLSAMCLIANLIKELITVLFLPKQDNNDQKQKAN